MLLKKLRLRPHQSLLVLNAPDGFGAFAEAGDIPCRVLTAPEAGVAAEVVLVFAPLREHLPERLEAALGALSPGGALWVAFRKGASAAGGYMTRDQGWEPARRLEMLPVSAISLDDGWSALRFKPEGEVLKKQTFSRPEIDYVNREVRAPADLRAALEGAGVRERFEALSFTKRKEMTLSVAEAQKPATRARRIQKVIEQLAAGSGSGPAGV